MITVEPLHEVVSDAFGRENFLQNLRNELAAAHQESLDNGLQITLNGIPLKYEPAKLMQSDKLKPAYRELTYGDLDQPRITVKIFAGISASNPSKGGWYVFCNGRMVLEADQIAITGWGDGDGRTIPRYHNQFAMFRGYIFFDCDDASKLPWNTTKTGVDAEAPVFRAVYEEMVTTMRPVIDFLNKLDREKKEEPENRQLEFELDTTPSVKLTEIARSNVFLSEDVTKVSSPPSNGRITYSKPMEEINRAKKALGVGSFKEVGEKTFDYYFHLEVED